MYLHMIMDYLHQWWVTIRDRVRDGCSHQHVTWPQRPRVEGRVDALVIPGTGTSKQRCLDCGRYRFIDLSTEELRIGREWFRDRIREWPIQRTVGVTEAEDVNHTQTYCGVLTITEAPGSGR